MSETNTPRIWVSSFGAYNDGRYYLSHGEWFNLADTVGMGPAEFVRDGIDAGRIKIKATPGTDAYNDAVKSLEMFHEELHAFDIELPGLDMGEFDLGQTVDDLVELYAELERESVDPMVFGAWFKKSITGEQPKAEHVETFRDQYLGAHDSPER